MSDNRDQKNRGPRKPGPAKKGGRGERPARGAAPRGRDFDAKGGQRDMAGRDDTRDKKRAPRREGAPFEKKFEKRGERPFARKPEKPRRILRTPSAPEAAPSTFEGERIAKVMARVGLCSRRDAEIWIAEGRVAVNGEKLKSPAVNVTPEDRISVDGKPIAKRERTRLFMFNKPRGFVTTDRDPEGRPTVFDALPEGLPRLISIGRLDINTEGLLLLTNDGGLARVLELPATGWLRRYRVRANGVTDQAQLDELRKGITIEGIEYAGIEAHLDRVQGANVWLTMGLREGKNREIKRVLEHLGLAVNRLIRLSYGPFQLGELEDGAVEEVRTRILIEQLGPKLAEEAGADFESPVLDRMPVEEEDERPVRAPRGKGPQREREEAPPPRKDRPAPRTRKHVSVLRATREEPPKERRRVERAETADRKGRKVSVERVVAPGAKAKSPTRNARRFAEERDTTSGERPRTGRNAKDAPKRQDRRGEKPRSEDRRVFKSSGADFNVRDREPTDFKPWSDKRPARSESSPRSESKPRGEFKPRGEGKPRSEFNPRGEFKPRGEGKPRGEFKPRSEFKPRGDKPGGARSGGRPGGARSGGKPAGKGPRGPRAPR